MARRFGGGTPVGDLGWTSSLKRFPEASGDPLGSHQVIEASSGPEEEFVVYMNWLSRSLQSCCRSASGR